MQLAPVNARADLVAVLMVELQLGCLLLLPFRQYFLAKHGQTVVGIALLAETRAGYQQAEGVVWRPTQVEVA